MSVFRAVIDCRGWNGNALDDPNPDDPTWCILENCVKRKKKYSISPSPLNNCGTCPLPQLVTMDYWACPSCHKVFYQISEYDGSIKNRELFSGSSECDCLHCPYCGYEADGYEYDLIHEVMRLR